MQARMPIEMGKSSRKTQTGQLRVAAGDVVPQRSRGPMQSLSKAILCLQHETLCMQRVPGGPAQRTSRRASKCGVCPRGFGYPGQPGLTRQARLTRAPPRRNNLPPLSVADQASAYAASLCPATHRRPSSPISRLRATIGLCAAAAKHCWSPDGIGHFGPRTSSWWPKSARLAVQLSYAPPLPPRINDRAVRARRARRTRQKRPEAVVGLPSRVRRTQRVR
jgi:hypothetical protein